MDAEKALRVADAAAFAKTKEHLTDIQRFILRGSWQGQNYDKIAESHDYASQHVKNEGSQLWRLLSDALGEKVTKRNFRTALERRSLSAELPQPQESAEKETVSKNTDFVGREEALNDLDNLVNDGAKVILIQAEGGVGKTTLAWEWFKREGLEPLELRVGRTPQNIQSAEDWVRLKLQDHFKENPEQNFLTMLEQLRTMLQTQRIGVLIDNLEPALRNGEFSEPHQSYYVELLTVLAHPSVQSITLVTSRERLHEHEIIRLPTVRTYPLESLKEKAWKEYFHNCNISTDVYAFSEMYRAYAGNAEAMFIFSGDIHRQPWKGDLKAYWQKNGDDLLRHRSLKSLVERQFNKLREDNRPAYELLCRLGFYPDRDVPSVPNAWLRCLLWDVPEKRRQQVINDLCDRSLVKVDDDGYYLHPVIGAEAIERLKSIDKSRRDYLRLIKEQIDLLVAPVQTIQDSLAWINKKFSLATKRYKKAAFRALYLEYLISEFDFDNCQPTEEEESKYFELAYLIDKKFEAFKFFQYLDKKLINNLDYCRRMIIQEVNHIIKLNVIPLERGIEELLEKAIKNRAKQLYEAWKETPISFIKDVEIMAGIAFEFIVNLNGEEEEILFFKKNGTLNSERQKFLNDTKQLFYRKIIKGCFSKKVFSNSFCNVLLGKKVKQLEVKINQLEVDRWYFIKCCKYSLGFKFSDEQKKLLQQYYDMNLLLVRCLDSASDTVRSHIEDELLLPIAEIEARRRLRD